MESGFILDGGFWRRVKDTQLALNEFGVFFEKIIRGDQKTIFQKCMERGFIRVELLRVQHFNNFENVEQLDNHGAKCIMIIEQQLDDSQLFNFRGFMIENKLKPVFNFSDFYEKWEKETEEEIKRSLITPVTFHLDLNFKKIDKMDEKRDIWFSHRIQFLHQLSNLLRELFRRYSLNENDYAILIGKATEQERQKLHNMILDFYFDYINLANKGFISKSDFRKELDNSSYKHCILMLVFDFLESKNDRHMKWWLMIEEQFLFLRLYFFHRIEEMIFIGQSQNCGFTKYIPERIENVHKSPLLSMYGREQFAKSPQFWIKLPIFEYPILLEKRIGVLREGFACINLKDLRDWVIPADYTKHNLKNFEDLSYFIQTLIKDNKLSLDNCLHLYRDSRQLLTDFFNSRNSIHKLNPELLPDIEDLCKNLQFLPLCQRLHAEKLFFSEDKHIKYDDRMDFRSFLLDLGYSTSTIAESWSKAFVNSSEQKMKKYLSNTQSNISTENSHITNCLKRIDGKTVYRCPYQRNTFDEIKKSIFISDENDLSQIQNLIEKRNFIEACAYELDSMTTTLKLYNPVSYTRTIIQRNKHRVKDRNGTTTPSPSSLSQNLRNHLDDQQQ